MATKAKNHIHPMPKLGWKDQLIYWFVMTLTGGFSLSCIFIVLAVQTKIAFDDPNVIAHTVGERNLQYFWFMLWCFSIFCFILVGPHQQRIPIFGRSDIKYGPPAFPRIYPIFMKNRPQHWVSPNELRKKKKIRLIVTALLVVSCLFSVLMFPLSFYGRAVLCDDGSIIVYNSHNKEVARYTSDEISHVELETYASGKYSNNWNIEFTITTSDSKMYHFAAHSFEGTDIQQLQTMLFVKESLYKGRCHISGTENLQKVIYDQYEQQEEKDLVYQLFEISQ